MIISAAFTSGYILRMKRCNGFEMKIKRHILLLLLLMAVLPNIIMAQSNLTQAKEAEVELKTTLGDISIKLYNDTPKHRDNFLKNVREGLYDGVLFHRVIKDFMIQAGDPTSKTADSTTMLGGGDPGYTIEAEIIYPKHFHKYGAVAAARTGDQVNPERRSSGSQFYIVTGTKSSAAELQRMQQQMRNRELQGVWQRLCEEHAEEIRTLQENGDEKGLNELREQLIARTEATVTQEIPQEIIDVYTTQGGTPHLDGQYTVFGEVVSGMDTVEKIENVPTGRADRPWEDVRILSAREIK